MRDGSWKLNSSSPTACSAASSCELGTLAAEQRASQPARAEEIRAVSKNASQAGEFISLADASLDVQNREFLRGNERTRLSPREFQLLKYLLQHRGETLSRIQLLQEVWHDNPMNMRALDMCVARLRQKVEPNPEKPCFILTIRGVGYKCQNSENSMKTE